MQRFSIAANAPFARLGVMRHAKNSPLPCVIQVSQTRRLFGLRFLHRSANGEQTFSRFGAVRWYSPGGNGPHQPQLGYGQPYGAPSGGVPMYQHPGGGYAQPGGGYPYYPPPAPPMQPQYMMSPPQPEIGTKDRPLIVAAMPQAPSWTSRVWLLLIIIIGISAAINVMEEFRARFGIDNGAPIVGGGGAQANRMASLFGVNPVKPVDLEANQVSFSDIQGVDEAKEELRDIVMFLKDPKKFTEVGARLPKGALLVGPPGCGKTMLAKAIAKESGVNFFYATGSEFDEMFVGVGARRIRELFTAAKENAPSLVFIDEIDSLASKRSTRDQSHSRMTLNQLLAEMDGFASSDEVIVIAATNTPEVLDKALTRPGRFDTTISIDPPDMKGRAAIVETYLKKIKKETTVTAMDIARGTTGFTGAELANLINVAAIRAVTSGRNSVSLEEIEYAKDRVMMGAENKSKKIPDDERRITAFHEGGHALIALLLEKEGTDPVHKATIIPRGSGIMGLVQQQPKEDKYSATKRGMMAKLKVCLGGRVAEELILGDQDITTGASSDFQQATNMARNMVRRFGFSDSLGMIDYQTAETNEGAFMSDSTKEKIETEVQKLVTGAYASAKDLLVANRDKLELIANKLLEYDTLSGEQLKAIVSGQPMPHRFAPPPPPKSEPARAPPPPSGNLPISLPVASTKSASMKHRDD